MAKRHRKNKVYQPEDSPAAWFVMLERARQTNDSALAARAQQELNRLGVTVTYKTIGAPPHKGGADVR